MKTNAKRVTALWFVGLCFFAIQSCKKEESTQPKVTSEAKAASEKAASEKAAAEKAAAEKADAESDDPADGAPKAAKKKPPVRETIYGAIIPAKGRNWFFKLRAPVAAAPSERANFKTFIETGLRALTLAVREPTSEESAHGN